MELLLDKTEDMSEKATGIYEKIFAVASASRRFNLRSIVFTRKSGYDGFADWHDLRCREFQGLEISVEDELFCRFHLAGDFKETDVAHNPADLQEHLTLWRDFLIDAMKKIRDVNVAHFNETGTACSTAYEMLDLILRDYGKVLNLISRFTESDWLAVDMHIADDRLKGDVEYERCRKRTA